MFILEVTQVIIFFHVISAASALLARVAYADIFERIRMKNHTNVFNAASALATNATCRYILEFTQEGGHMIQSV